MIDYIFEAMGLMIAQAWAIMAIAPGLTVAVLAIVIGSLTAIALRLERR